MTNETRIGRLETLPNEIENAERHVIELAKTVDKARDTLKEKENAIILGEISGMELTGKNAETRAAQMKGFTEVERDQLRQAEEELANYRVRYNRLLNDFSALRAIARILAGREVA